MNGKILAVLVIISILFASASVFADGNVSGGSGGGAVPTLISADTSGGGGGGQSEPVPGTGGGGQSMPVQADVVTLGVGESAVRENIRIKLQVVKIGDGYVDATLNFNGRDTYFDRTKDVDYTGCENTQEPTVREFTEPYEDQDLLYAAQVVYRSHYACSGEPDTNRVWNGCSATLTNGRQIIQLRVGYWNFRCQNRYNEHCVWDGSYDFYYDEACDYGLLRFRIGELKYSSDFSLQLVSITENKAVFQINAYPEEKMQPGEYQYQGQIEPQQVLVAVPATSISETDNAVEIQIDDAYRVFNENCENSCGDGTCQQVVCTAIGCPCAETPVNCPQDCGASSGASGGGYAGMVPVVVMPSDISIKVTPVEDRPVLINEKPVDFTGTTSVPAISVSVRESAETSSATIPVTIYVDEVKKITTIQAGEVSATTRETIKVENSEMNIEREEKEFRVHILPAAAASSSGRSGISEIELKVADDKPVYDVSGTESSKVLGLIPVQMQIMTRVSAENGETVRTEKPWWSFLAW
jgi:hypothetical protein